MKSIFSPAGKEAFFRLITPQTLFGFDFDGTLTPYFTDPDDVFTPPQIAASMKALCRQVDVAVVTGRSIRSVKPKLKFRPKYIVGNHGIDGLETSLPKLPLAREIANQWMRTIQGIAKDGVVAPGVTIENKIYSLTFHYRASLNRPRARAAIERAIRKLTPKPRLVGGKFVYNLVPAGLPHKGDAMREILRLARRRNVFFIGDDVTDEDVFRRAPANWMTVRVGKSAGSAARFYVPSFADVPRLLEWIVNTTRK